MQRVLEVLLGFDVFGQQAGVLIPVHSSYVLDVVPGSAPEIDHEEVGEIDQGFSWIVERESVKGNLVACLLQLTTCHFDFSVRKRVGADSRHNFVRGEKSHAPFEENVTRTRDEGKPVIGENVQSQKTRYFDGRAAGSFRFFPGEMIDHPGPEEQSVADDGLIRGKNGLPGCIASRSRLIVDEVFGHGFPSE